MKGSIGIERKTISDLLASVKDGRLFDQVTRLCDTYEYPVLLIEGSLYPFIVNPILSGTYTSLLYGFKNLKIAHSRDHKGTVAFIKQSAMYIGPTGRRPPAVREKKVTPEEIRVAMLTAIKDIGWEKAKRVNKAVPDLFKNTKYRREELVKKLTKIKGIGKRTAELIADVFLEV
jgi:ERCC4-type nuclease